MNFGKLYQTVECQEFEKSMKDLKNQELTSKEIRQQFKHVSCCNSYITNELHEIYQDVGYVNCSSCNEIIHRNDNCSLKSFSLKFKCNTCSNH